jgi:hypothetical protein
MFTCIHPSRESRRINSALQDSDGAIQKIRMKNGEVSEWFPNTLRQLFQFDGKGIPTLR